MKTPLSFRLAVMALATWHLSAAIAQGQFNYTINNGAITITEYTGTGGAVTIPSTIAGLPVTSIGDSACLGWGSSATWVRIW